MKHKHSEMAKAKLDNMDLVVFRLSDNNGWELMGRSILPTMESYEYFVCIPQHKDSVLNALNGGESEVNYGDNWSKCNCNDPTEWNPNWWYMKPDCKSRIKPRKEKRWIGVSTETNTVTDLTFRTKETMMDYVNKKFAYPEKVEPIEIEVTIL